jgi:hypothetical protein
MPLQNYNQVENLPPPMHQQSSSYPIMDGAGGGYQTQDMMNPNTNAFLEAIRSFAINPDQLKGLFNTGAGNPTGSVIPSAPVKNQNQDKGDVNFLRGIKNIEELPPWERAEVMKKQKVQNDMQSVLRQQMAEKEAEKAMKLAKKKEVCERVGGSAS